MFLFAVAAFCVGYALVLTLGSYAIERAHRGEGFGFLQRVMDARETHSASFYRAKLVGAATTLLAACIATTSLVLISTSRWFFQRFVGGATARSLAYVRILVCTILFFDAVTIDLGDAAIFPADTRLPMGIITVLAALPLGLEELNASATALRVWQAMTAVCLLLSVLGWRTRWVLPLALGFYLVQGGIIRQYDRLFHTGLTPLYVLAVLCFTPCADAWSMDRRRRARRGEALVPGDERFATYGWSRYVCWLPVVLMYVEAGLTKLVHVGPHWASASNLRAILLRDSVERAELRPVFIPHLLAMPDLMFGMMGVATLIAETLFFLVLFFVVARRVLPVMMMLMHLGIWVFQGLRFFDLVALQLIFYDPTPAIERARQRLTQRAEQGDAVAGRAPAGAWRTRWAYPIGGCAIIVVMLGVWSRQIEFYPLSSMNLYASFNGTSEVKHMRILAHYDGGRQERVYLQHLVDLLDRTNYRQSIARGFMPEAHPDCQLARRYVRACLEAHNRRNPTQLIHALEIQEWRWDYRKQPAGGFGDVARRYVVPMTEVAAAGSGK